MATKEKKKVVLLFTFLSKQVTDKRKKRRLSHDNPIFSFNLKSNTMKNTVQKYCFYTN